MVGLLDAARALRDMGAVRVRVSEGSIEVDFGPTIAPRPIAVQPDAADLGDDPEDVLYHSSG